MFTQRDISEEVDRRGGFALLLVGGSVETPGARRPHASRLGVRALLVLSAFVLVAAVLA
jgi:hypothetical protein